MRSIRCNPVVTLLTLLDLSLNLLDQRIFKRVAA